MRARITDQSVGSDAEDFSPLIATIEETSDDDAHPGRADSYKIPEVPRDATNVELRQLLDAAHVTLYQMKSTIRELETSIYELKRDKKLRERSQPKSKSKAKVVTSEEHQIALYGRKFCIMNEFSIPRSAFLKPRPAIHSDHLHRWDSDATVLEGLVAELYEEIPDKFHHMLEGSTSFRDIFRSKLDAFRRIMIHTLRTEIAPQVFDRKTIYYVSKFDRSTLEEFVQEVFFPGALKFSKYAPILFPNRIRDLRVFLRCDHLAMMLRAILFGPAALSKKPEPSTVGFLWNVKQVSPGAIAFVAVMAIFLHSTDESFAATGAKSKIRYGEIFAAYKELIIKGLVAKNKRYINLIQWYNAQVFGDTVSDETGLAGPAGGDASTIEEALREDEEEGELAEQSFAMQAGDSRIYLSDDDGDGARDDDGNRGGKDTEDIAQDWHPTTTQPMSRASTSIEDTQQPGPSNPNRVGTGKGSMAPRVRFVEPSRSPSPIDFDELLRDNPQAFPNMSTPRRITRETHGVHPRARTLQSHPEKELPPGAVPLLEISSPETSQPQAPHIRQKEGPKLPASTAQPPRIQPPRIQPSRIQPSRSKGKETPGEAATDSLEAPGRTASRQSSRSKSSVAAKNSKGKQKEK